jgi:hypothetical protein
LINDDGVHPVFRAWQLAQAWRAGFEILSKKTLAQIFRASIGIRTPGITASDRSAKKALMATALAAFRDSIRLGPGGRHRR